MRLQNYVIGKFYRFFYGWMGIDKKPIFFHFLLKPWKAISAQPSRVKFNYTKLLNLVSSSRRLRKNKKPK